MAARITVPLNGHPADIVGLAFPPDVSIALYPSPLFPAIPPAAVLKINGAERHLPLAWPTDGTPGEKLLAALRAFVASSEAYRIAYGFDPARPLTHNAAVAARAGWPLLLTGAPLAPSSRAMAAQRVDPALVDALASSNVLIVGLGSVGSYMAEQFTRSGVGALGLIDHDIVEDGNLSRTVYDRGDTGLSKAEALSRRLLNIAPDLALETVGTTFQQSDPELLRALFQAADVVIAATDDPTAQAQINSCAQFADKPALHVGLYKGAKGGEIGISVPGLTPCFRCQIGATRVRSHGAEDAHRATDYGTGRLFGEIALGCDIQHVSSAALKLAFSLLAALKGVQGGLAEFTIGAVQRDLHLLTIGMEPEWWFYPEMFRETPGQYAYQSIWLTARKREGCPDCDPGPERADPFAHLSGSIDADALRRALGRAGGD
jgi:hypothetical protein